MFRFKVTVTLTLIIVALTAVIYVLLPWKIESDRRAVVRESLNVAATSIERNERLDDFAMIERASEIAEFPGLATAMTGDYEGNYEYQRHLAVYNKGLLRWKYAYENLEVENGSKRNIDLPLNQRRPFVPELLFITDEKAIGVAALGTNRYDWYNDNIEKMHPGLLDSVKDGKPTKDFWVWRWGEGQNVEMYHIGIAPVMQGSEKVVGIVVVGTLVADEVAKSAGASIGEFDVAFFRGERVFGSTLDSDTGEILAAALFGEDSPLKKETATPGAVEVEIAGVEYLVMVRYHTGHDVSTPTGFVVLANLDEGFALAKSVRIYTIVFGLLALILILGSVTFLVYLFIKPLEQIDQGIQEVIAGNKDYVFEAGGSFGGEMAQALNLMSAYLQGKKMPDEDEGEGQWSEFMVSEVSQSGIMRAVHAKDIAAARAKAQGNVVGVPMMGGGAPPASSEAEPADGAPAEDRDTYLKRIHQEYVTAKKSIGADASDIDFEGFAARLDKNTLKLREKHKAKDVRFSVVVREGKVVLKPTPIF